MDGIANVARQQQSQINSSEAQVNTTLKAQQQTQQVQETKTPDSADILKEIEEQAETQGTRLNSKEDVEALVEKLNEAMAPMSTSIKFGVDMQDIFYVSVIEAQTDRMIRRFPAEQAQDFLPKMQEVSGILFDAVG